VKSGLDDSDEVGEADYFYPKESKEAAFQQKTVPESPDWSAQSQRCNPEESQKDNPH
jgi:hypothetical protein